MARGIPVMLSIDNLHNANENGSDDDAGDDDDDNNDDEDDDDGDGK